MDSNVYNHLLATYRPKALTKYDTHKASELRTVVNRIANITKTSPVYLVKLTDAKQSYALGVKESSMLLNDGFKELSDESPEGVFAQKKAYSSNPGSVSVDVTGQDMDKIPDRFTLKIDHLATIQVNTSEEMYAAASGMRGGTYKLRVSVADDIYDLQYNVKKDSTNEDVMRGVASFINKANIGLNADVYYVDNNQQKMQMSIESELTGASEGETIFTIADKANEKRTGIVDYLGINHVDEHPTCSKFYMDGVEKHTLSNEFTIGKALKVSMKDVTDDEVAVEYLPDSEKIMGGVNKVIDAYNYMVDSTDEYSRVTDRFLKLVSEMRNIISPYEPELESCGISFDDDGHMQLDKALATQAINEGDMQKMFSSDSDFVNKMLRKTDDIKLNPMDYVDKVMVSYPNYGKTPTGYSYITSLYSGMIFNYYC